MPHHRPALGFLIPAEEVTMAQTVQLDVNGTSHRMTVDDPDMPLLYALRDELALGNPRFGCGLAQCGACTVHVDGEPTRSCVTPLSAVTGRKVVTLAGLGTPDHPHPLQTAFAEGQATQCGYCMNGWIMTAAALIRDKPRATVGEIKQALTGLKCRCGTHMSIIRAVARVTGAA
jgi:aerobic-type carbon monoxide dehydrogenase small subunit (CoxS/CutS family)